MERNSTDYFFYSNNYTETIVCLLGIFGFVGNMFVVVVIIKCPALHTCSNYLTASLAIVDLTSSVVMMFNMTNSALLVVMVYLTFASLAHLLAISVDKYLLITRPFSYHTSNKKVFISICLAWTIPFITLVNPKMLIITVCANGFAVSWIMVFSQIFSLLTYFTIIAINVRMYIIARKQSRQINAIATGQPRQMETYSASWKATKTTIIVIGAFSTSSAPTFTITFLFSLCCEMRNIMSYLWYPLLSINPILNPVIYTIRRHEFQNAARNVIRTLKMC
ncbi:lysophosphatidic acid receptor 1-B-like [Anneissia japonica]|uniref:lysophosphatidic acid receptor 1-B-like n=1 Tax=Anneissia japonica TaxID=1529436 RepID=UPI0014257130|nr:lysophosphatidic acid receptor 1-B-like [Anneissia japonica]